MSFSKKITRSLLRATCDKTEFNKQALRLCRCFREVCRLLNEDCPKNKGHHGHPR